MKRKWINLILSFLLIAYLVISYVLSDGNQLLYGFGTSVKYLYPIVVIIAIYSTISYGKIALVMYRSNHKYKAVCILLLSIVLLLLFIYQLTYFI